MYAVKYKNKYGHGWIEVSSLEEAAEFIGIRIVENPKTSGWIIKQGDDSIAFYTSEWTADEAWRDFCRDLMKKRAAGVLAVYKMI